MKLIRLTDDRYIFDAGPDITQREMEEIRAFWDEWWGKNLTVPEAMVVGGSLVPLEYEDRRESDIEARLQRLEQHFHFTDDKKWTGKPYIPPPEAFVAGTNPPVGGIEQYQAEDR